MSEIQLEPPASSNRAGRQHGTLVESVVVAKRLMLENQDAFLQTYATPKCARTNPQACAGEPSGGAGEWVQGQRVAWQQ